MSRNCNSDYSDCHKQKYEKNTIISGVVKIPIAEKDINRLENIISEPGVYCLTERVDYVTIFANEAAIPFI